MTEVLPEFRVVRPDSAQEAAAAHRDNEGARYLAGGTDLIPNVRRGIGEPDLLIDLGGIAELKKIEVGANGARIGAGVTLAHLALNAEIAAAYPAVITAAKSNAGPGSRASFLHPPVAH